MTPAWERALPAGWRWVRLGDVAEYYNGRAFKPDDWGKTGLPIIRIQNLNSLVAPFHYFAGDVAPHNRVDNDDLLISWSASLDAYIWRRGPAVDKLDQLRLGAVDQTHIFTLSQVYEGLLLKMGEKNNDGGQFFTPREVIRALVRVIDPQVG
jgi:hypothetical protein